MIRKLIAGTSLLLLIAMSAAPGADDLSSRAQREWPLVGGDYGNTRYSGLSRINTSNVKELAGAWFRKLSAGTRTPPVIVGQAMFINDATTIYKLDLKNGDTIWEYKPEAGSPARGGVALGGGLAYYGLSDSRIIALDQKTGKLVWTGYIGNAPRESGGAQVHAQFGESNPAFNAKVGFVANAPVYVNGVVVSGLTGGDAGVRGKISGLDAKTGKLLWNFYMIPASGDVGSETWPAGGEALNKGGGAVWTHGAADPSLGLVYYGTGNAVPQASGDLRAGDNLYTSSVVALTARTGALRWHYQLTHHDIWEMDAATPMVLYSARENGKPRKALAAMRTDGYLFMLDRETGKPLFPVEERPVKQDARQRTSPTQPFPVGADKFGPFCADPETLPTGFVPGCYFDPPDANKPNVLIPLYSARHAPMSFDPQTGYFYVMGAVFPYSLRRVENPDVFVPPVRPPGAKAYGLYAAIDSRTDKIVWQKRSSYPLALGSGALTTAGGLLFHLEPDGNVLASDARTGELLWQFQTGLLPISAPSGLPSAVPLASYEFEGEQYIAAPVGNGVWAFKLGGAIGSQPAPPRPPTEVGFEGMVKQLPEDGSGEILVAPQVNSRFANSPEFVDEYAFSPTRARVGSGIAFKWTNHGTSPHTIVAEDGTWTTGSIPPGQSATISIAKPGTYIFLSKEYPWAKGSLIVQ